MKLEDFYAKVIEDFGTKLINKYSQKEQGFDSESIDLIKSVYVVKIRKSDKSSKNHKNSSREPYK